MKVVANAVMGNDKKENVSTMLDAMLLRSRSSLRLRCMHWTYWPPNTQPMEGETWDGRMMTIAAAIRQDFPPQFCNNSRPLLAHSQNARRAHLIPLHRRALINPASHHRQVEVEAHLASTWLYTSVHHPAITDQKRGMRMRRCVAGSETDARWCMSSLP